MAPRRRVFILNSDLDQTGHVEVYPNPLDGQCITPQWG
jgi:hypothetical protein